jgi:hypothetical protein
VETCLLRAGQREILKKIKKSCSFSEAAFEFKINQ